MKTKTTTTMTTTEQKKQRIIESIYQNCIINGYDDWMIEDYLSNHPLKLSRLVYNKGCEISICLPKTIVVHISEDSKNKTIFRPDSSLYMGKNFEKKLKSFDKKLYDKIVEFFNKTLNESYYQFKEIIEERIQKNHSFCNFSFLRSSNTLIHKKTINKIKYWFYVKISTNSLELKITNSIDDQELIFDILYYLH